MDINRITTAIEAVAEACEDKAKSIRELSEQLKESGDLSIIGEVIQTCCSFANMRIDLIVTRAIRELERDMKQQENAE